MKRQQGLTSLQYVLLYCLGFALLSALCSSVAWGSPFIWDFSDRYSVIILSFLTYTASFLLLISYSELPRLKGIDLIGVAVSLVYIAAFAVAATGRFYYSRSFLIVAFLFNVLWLLIVYKLIIKKFIHSFVFIPRVNRSFSWLQKRNVNLLEATSKEDILKKASGVILSHEAHLSDQDLNLVNDLSFEGLNIYTEPFIYEALNGRIGLDYYKSGLLCNIRANSRYYPVKRVIDLVLILLFSPLILAVVIGCSFLVFVSSKGSIFFRQKRVGYRGREFTLYKFRTMTTDSESSGAQFAQKGDTRTTMIGKILRKLHLDEIPQLWNVFKGDMSLVGPRPEQAFFVNQFVKDIPLYAYRHMVKPGLTGWAQVSQGYAAGEDETRTKLEYDLYYIKNQSFWFDMFIFFKTFRTTIIGWGSR